MHPAPNDEPNQIPVADSSQKNIPKCRFFSGCKFPKMFPNVLVTKHMGCMHQALACLAHLASHRPRSPCLHQQQQQRRSAPPGRRRRPGCCCEVQARRARPIRGEVSQARPGQGPSTVFFILPIWALGPLFGLWPGASTVFLSYTCSGPCMCMKKCVIVC